MRWLAVLVLLGCADGVQTEPAPLAPVGDAAVGGRADGALRDGAPVVDAAADTDADPAPDAAVRGRDATRPAPDAAPPVETVAVSHEREFRAVWIATVFNINFPSRAGLDAARQQAELRGLFDAVAGAHLNAVMLQVRPEGDALYRSELEPFSRFLTGEQGGDPGYDPLAFAIDEAHARGLELHAWINPYRAAASQGIAQTANHVARRYPQHAHRYGSAVVMDPGAAEVRGHTVAVIEDLVTRYDLDGVHFDDYFYPYPDGSPYPDDATWQAYRDGGGALDRDDWRRDNVNQMVEAAASAIARIDRDVRFGISPFGIYRPGVPEGITGLDQYAAIYADPVRWIEAGWVDYLAPQLYWNRSRPRQDYETLLRWWAGLTHDGHQIYAGNYLAQLGSEAAWDLGEFERQIGISRLLRPQGSWGNIFFHVEPIVENRGGLVDMLRARFYQRPAATPVLAGRAEPVAPPRVSVRGATVALEHADPVRAFLIYADADGGWRVSRMVRPPTAAVELGAGRWAISAIGRHGVESAGVLVEVP